MIGDGRFIGIRTCRAVFRSDMTFRGVGDDDGVGARGRGCRGVERFQVTVLTLVKQDSRRWLGRPIHLEVSASPFGHRQMLRCNQPHRAGRLWVKLTLEMTDELFRSPLNSGRNRRHDRHGNSSAAFQRNLQVARPQKPQVAACLARGCDSRFFPTSKNANKINALSSVLGAP
jgi:hypothetical protein